LPSGANAVRPPARSAFGLRLLSELKPPGAWAPPQAGGAELPTLRLRTVPPRVVAERWSGAVAIGWQGVNDGAPFVVERGRAADHRFVHGEPPDRDGRPAAGTRAVHHLSADMATLLCAPTEPADPSWWRVALDSTLFTIALLHGYEALHAGALATPEGAIAISAASGGGKSTLVGELLRGGLELMADDVLVLERRGEDEPPLAHPAPPLMTVPAEPLSTLSAPSPVEASPLNGARGDARAAQAICSLDGERWIAAPVHPTPLPLRALVALDRRRGAALSLQRIEDPLAPLLGALMHFPRTPQRERARFELASVLAATVELWRLTADLSTPPEALADALGALSRC